MLCAKLDLQVCWITIAGVVQELMSPHFAHLVDHQCLQSAGGVVTLDRHCLVPTKQLFLGHVQELEEDPEMRSKVALYKDPAHNAAAAQQRQQDAMTDGEEDDLPDIPLDELLDDMNALQIQEGGEGGLSDEDVDME